MFKMKRTQVHKNYARKAHIRPFSSKTTYFQVMHNFEESAPNDTKMTHPRSKIPMCICHM